MTGDRVFDAGYDFFPGGVNVRRGEVLATMFARAEWAAERAAERGTVAKSKRAPRGPSHSLVWRRQHAASAWPRHLIFPRSRCLPMPVSRSFSETKLAALTAISRVIAHDDRFRLRLEGLFSDRSRRVFAQDIRKMCDSVEGRTFVDRSARQLREIRDLQKRTYLDSAFQQLAKQKGRKKAANIIKAQSRDWNIDWSPPPLSEGGK